MLCTAAVLACSSGIAFADSAPDPDTPIPVRDLAAARQECAVLLLIAPVRHSVFGGITECFLPPDHRTRLVQEHFDEIFPLWRIDPIYSIMMQYIALGMARAVHRCHRAAHAAGPGDYAAAR
ncbi:hypothetical protein ACW2Q0_25535 [Nocardia sp. R16R-3T]